MQKPATGKLSEMIRSAGTPMRSISSDASKIRSSWFGMAWNSSVPAAMIVTAALTP